MIERLVAGGISNLKSTDTVSIILDYDCELPKDIINYSNVSNYLEE